jgi:hypothetical protein
MPGSALSVPQLLARVDYALYQAKSAGRNCIYPGSAVGADGRLLEWSATADG